ncbi:hypothetical protein [Actibacterium sp. MT2.3-13A]|uniref:hypothetical protein n=1 Tax=Actibacterium sp. MT2.3-13A TaxID=2828332 RepID=UPI001BA8B91C|nr:hypothetical protein [Actibacterium sp. MT2.3-13A]
MNYFDAVAALQLAAEKIREAATALSVPDLAVEHIPEAEADAWLPYAELAPGNGRRPAQRAFPELSRFWAEDAGQDPDDKNAFLLFGRAALSFAASAAGEPSPAEWIAGLDEAFKKRRNS